jgi:hypothetical protein
MKFFILVVALATGVVFSVPAFAQASLTKATFVQGCVTSGISQWQRELQNLPAEQQKLLDAKMQEDLLNVFCTCEADSLQAENPNASLADIIRANPGIVQKEALSCNDKTRTAAREIGFRKGWTEHFHGISPVYYVVLGIWILYRVLRKKRRY